VTEPLFRKAAVNLVIAFADVSVADAISRARVICRALMCRARGRSMFGYTWVSFGLEAVSWWHRAIYCTVLSPPTPPVGHCSEPWYWSDDIGAAAGRTGSAPPSLVVGQMVALKYLQCATQACRHVLCTAVGGQSQSQIRRLSGSVLAIWERLWNCAIGALGRPRRLSAAESSRQSVVCRPLVSG